MIVLEFLKLRDEHVLFQTSYLAEDSRLKFSDPMPVAQGLSRLEADLAEHLVSQRGQIGNALSFLKMGQFSQDNLSELRSPQLEKLYSILVWWVMLKI